ncbi:MAG: lipid A deacylase LpxR family protein [Verrucomicrobiota bacterium]
MNTTLTRLSLLAILGALPLAASAEPTPADDDRLHFGSLSIYTENDKFFAGTDRNYTNGFKLTALTTDLRDFEADEVPAPLRAIANRLEPLLPKDAAPKIGLSIGQNIYTPENTQLTTAQPADRPYAAWLYGSVMFQSYRPAGEDRALATLDTWELQLGVVGPWALGEQVQNGFHRIINVDTAKGWDHQIDNEPGLNLVYERKWRLETAGARTGWGADLIPHAGFSLGNVFTYANAGGAVRFGYKLPADFGTSLIRPTGDSNAGRRERFGVWLFGSVDGRAVARDLTLDGNTFEDSPSIDKNPFVADLVGGIALGTRRWQLTYAQALRTKEFDGQRDNQVFGSLSLSYFY